MSPALVISIGPSSKRLFYERQTNRRPSRKSRNNADGLQCGQS
jgi:hypothetical protein